MQTNTKVYGPYSPIVKADNTYYISGQVGIDTQSNQTAEGIAAQTQHALKNLQAILTDAGLSMNDVVKTTVYLTDMGDFEAMNNAYTERFVGKRPARTTVAVKELPRLGKNQPLLVEIEAVAVKSYIRKASQALKPPQEDQQ